MSHEALKVSEACLGGHGPGDWIPNFSTCLYHVPTLPSWIWATSGALQELRQVTRKPKLCTRLHHGRQ